MARNGSTAACGAKVDGKISGSSGTATVSGQGRRALCAPINCGRKRYTGDDDDVNKGGLSAPNIMGMMMMQQRSKQSLRDADHTVREAELALW